MHDLNIFYIWSLGLLWASSVHCTFCVPSACSHYRRYCCCLHWCSKQHRKIVLKVPRYPNLHYISWYLSCLYLPWDPFLSGYFGIFLVFLYIPRVTLLWWQGHQHIVPPRELKVLNSWDKAASTMKKSKGLSNDPWCTPTFTSASSICIHYLGQDVQPLNLFLTSSFYTLSNCIKYLGLYLDKQLTGNYQSKLVMQKLARALPMIWKVKY